MYQVLFYVTKYLQQYVNFRFSIPKNINFEWVPNFAVALILPNTDNSDYIIIIIFILPTDYNNKLLTLYHF